MEIDADRAGTEVDGDDAVGIGEDVVEEGRDRGPEIDVDGDGLHCPEAREETGAVVHQTGREGVHGGVGSSDARGDRGDDVGDVGDEHPVLEQQHADCVDDATGRPVGSPP